MCDVVCQGLRCWARRVEPKPGALGCAERKKCDDRLALCLLPRAKAGQNKSGVRRFPCAFGNECGGTCVQTQRVYNLDLLRDHKGMGGKSGIWFVVIPCQSACAPPKPKEHGGANEPKVPRQWPRFCAFHPYSRCPHRSSVCLPLGKADGGSRAMRSPFL